MLGAKFQSIVLKNSKVGRGGGGGGGSSKVSWPLKVPKRLGP